MSEIPEALRYTKTHEWVRTMDDGHLEVGITDHAQEMMGDMVFVELPDVGDSVVAGQDCAVVESVKAASDVYAPISGEIVEINDTLRDSPEFVNQHPYEGGWLFRVRPTEESELENLLNAEAYSDVAAAEA